MGANDLEIVSFVERNAPVALAVLAGRFHVKERTARAYIKQANEMLSGAAAIEWSRSDGGYVLNVIDAQAFDAWKARIAPTSANDVLSTSEGRVSYLLDDLLSRADWITLDELSQALYVSRTSISADLKQVEHVLARYNLSLERRPHYGIRVTGSEMSRRLCLAGIVVDKLDDDDAQKWITSHGSVGIAETVSRCVEAVLAREDFQINSFVHQNLLVHISIALVRIREGKYVPMEAGQLEQIRGTRAYEVAEGIARAIESELSCELPEEEVAYMAIHLAGKRLLSAGSENERGLVITDEVWDVVSEMLELVFRTFRFDFREDLELRMNLARHIVPLSVRLTYHLAVENPILADVKARFPLAYSMAVDSSSVLAAHYGSELSEDEMGYIALAFALALDRQKTELPKKRILVVCASGRGSAKLLEHRYRKEFGPYLESVEACDAAQVARLDLSNIDYIFTTVPLHMSLPVPVREVKYFLDVEDIARVREMLENGVGEQSAAERYLNADLFFPYLACASKEEAIAFLCEHACAVDGVDAELEDLVWERERAGATAFGNSVALPHPMRAASDRTFLAIGLLDEPIDWDGQQVRAIFLIVISRTGHDELESFYESMAELFIDPAAIRKLLDSQTFETLQALVRRNTKGA